MQPSRRAGSKPGRTTQSIQTPKTPDFTDGKTRTPVPQGTFTVKIIEGRRCLGSYTMPDTMAEKLRRAAALDHQGNVTRYIEECVVVGTDHRLAPPIESQRQSVNGLLCDLEESYTKVRALMCLMSHYIQHPGDPDGAEFSEPVKLGIINLKGDTLNRLGSVIEAVRETCGTKM
jgi:hypothetical protein